MRTILKWVGIVLGGLVGLTLILALGLYVFGPDPVIATAEADIAAQQEVVFAQFTDYEYWFELWDVVGMTPPEAPVGRGSTFQFVEPDGMIVDGTITDYEQDRVFAADLQMGGVDGDFYFSLILEPAADGTHAVLQNVGSVNGPMKVMLGFYEITGGLDSYYNLVMTRLKTEVER